MGQIYKAVVQTALCDDANEHTLDFDFRDFAVNLEGIRAYLNGNVSVNFTIEMTTGDDATPAVTLKARAMNMKSAGETDPVVCANDIQTILNAAELADDGRYSYPITSPFGACDGIQIGFTYADGVDGVTELTVTAWLEAE